MPPKPDSDQLEDLRATFALFDDNGDGEITAAELGNVMRALGLKPSETELQDLMNEIDVDRSGTICFDGTPFTFVLLFYLSCLSFCTISPNPSPQMINKF